jgi:hypothetical protein
MILGLSLMSSGAWAAFGKATRALHEDALLHKKVEFDSRRHPVFSEANRQYFKAQREAVRQAVSDLKAALPGVSDQAIYQAVAGMMENQSLLVYGPPGGPKSELAKLLVQASGDQYSLAQDAGPGRLPEVLGESSKSQIVVSNVAPEVLREQGAEARRLLDGLTQVFVDNRIESVEAVSPILRARSTQFDRREASAPEIQPKLSGIDLPWLSNLAGSFVQADISLENTLSDMRLSVREMGVRVERKKRVDFLKVLSQPEEKLGNEELLQRMAERQIRAE